MEEIILAEDILEKVEGLLHQINEVYGGTFSMTEELLYEIKDNLEDIIG